MVKERLRKKVYLSELSVSFKRSLQREWSNLRLTSYQVQWMVFWSFCVKEMKEKGRN